MKIRELFIKDPLSWHIVNEGVSSNASEDIGTLRYELQTFVCEGEYRSGLVKILQGYLGNLGREQKAAWVSGFYGSGKSHLVKVLRYLWSDFKFPDGNTARGLATLPEDVVDLLKELSTCGKRGAGLRSAGGTLKAGVGSVRLRLLSVVFRSAGLPEKLSLARLIMDLKDEGKLKAIQAAITAGGKDPDMEFGKLYTSKALQAAYLESHPHLGDIKNVSEALRAQYPTKVEDISIPDMLNSIRRALAVDKKIPGTVIVLDEVQQFINNNAETALEVQEMVEACCKELDGQVLFVGTGQSALSDTPALQRLMGRFTIKVHLKDNDVEKVVRTVVLQKKEARKKDIEGYVSKQLGEVTRQLKTTRIASKREDDDAYVPDYPLLPVRRRFWEHVLHSIDPTGTAAQMRTQLRVTHEACQSAADKTLGAVIPADFLYDQLANDLVISGEMQKRFQEIVEEQKAKPEGLLRSRICALAFLINKLPREGADIGVRSTVEHLSDLLTDDLGHSATALREKIPLVVRQLADDGVLMDIEGEYRLQTTEGAAWESEFRRRYASIKNNDPQIAAQRGQLLSKAIHADLAGVTVLQGAAREKRKIVIHHGMEQPAASDGVVVWVRDGFQEPEAAVIQDVQRRSVDDATIHVLIPKTKTDELKNALAASLAAEETLNSKGNPTTQEGREARASMATRQNAENGKVEALIADVIGGARIFLSGGHELSVITLAEAVEDAARQVLSRLYPKFEMADSANWPAVWRKAKDGNAAALQSIGHQGDPDQHSVAAELIRFIGAGKKGGEVSAKYMAAPYGWPKDALDAVLATLLLSGHLSARLQGKAVKLADLDQRKIGQAEYRVERPVITAKQKLRIKKLFQEAGYRYQPGDEIGAAPGFVVALRALSASSGGLPPLPEPPRSPHLAEIEGLVGNDLLFRLFENADKLSEEIAGWKTTAEIINTRQPVFELASQLLPHATGLAGMESRSSALDAIRSNRSLLDDPDPVAPVLKAAGEALRAALQEAYGQFASALSAERAKIMAHPVWIGLPPEKRKDILQSEGIADLPPPPMGTEQELLESLRICDLPGWRTRTDALPTRFSHALADAIRESEPKARRIALPAATIRSGAETEAWLKEARAKIEEGLKEGPVIL